MPFYVYVLESSITGQYYKGQAVDVDARLQEHNSGKTKSTRSQAGSWKVVYTEEHSTREEALDRERYLKSAAGRRFLKKILSSE
ncbi:MAG: GIY-YIG nuclease family protein [Cryomorphaceae bacterium]